MIDKNIQIRERILEIYNKCKQDPIYFMENIAYIKGLGGKTRIKLNAKQRLVVDLFLKNQNILAAGSRQQGKSEIVRLLIAWCLRHFPGYTFGEVTLTDDKHASKDVANVKYILENLPSWYRPKYRKSRGLMIELTNNSLYMAMGSGGDIEGKCKSHSFVSLWIDEFSNIRNADELIESVIPTVSEIQRKAKENGIPHSIIATFNATKLTPQSKRVLELWTLANRGEDTEFGFKPVFFYWRHIIPESEHKQYEQRIKKMLALADPDPVAVERKWLVQYEFRFLPEEDSLISQVAEQMDIQVKPFAEYRFDSEYEPIWLFKTPDPRRVYVIGVDVATSFGTDYCAVQVIDYYTGEQVAEYWAKHPTIELLPVLHALVDIFPLSIIAIERTGVGMGLAELTIQDEILRPHCYYTETVIDGSNLRERYKPGKRRTTQQSVLKEYHVNTDSRTKQMMLETLTSVIIQDPSVVKSERLYMQLLTFEETKSKAHKLAHGKDLVMAFAIAQYVAKHGKLARKFAHIFSMATCDEVLNDESLLVSEQTKRLLSDVQTLNTMDNKKIASLLTQVSRELERKELEQVHIQRGVKGKVLGLVNELNG